MKTKGTANSIDRHVGKKLRTFRKLRGYSQEKVGEAINVTFQQVQKYERGTNRVSASKLYALANFFDVNVNAFYEGLYQIENSVSDIIERQAREIKELRRVIDNVKKAVKDENHTHVTKAELRK